MTRSVVFPAQLETEPDRQAGRTLKLYQMNKDGQFTIVPNGGGRSDKRWTVRAGFIYAIPLVMLLVLIAIWLRR